MDIFNHDYMKEFKVNDYSYYSRLKKGAEVYVFIGITSVIFLTLIFLLSISNVTKLMLMLFFLAVFLFTCVGFIMALRQNRVFLYSIVFTKDKIELFFKKYNNYSFSKSIAISNLRIKIEDIDSRNTYRMIFFEQNEICFVQVENRVWTSDMFKDVLIFFNSIKGVTGFYNYIQVRNINNFEPESLVTGTVYSETGGTV